jgi:hypothetical protein
LAPLFLGCRLGSDDDLFGGGDESVAEDESGETRPGYCSPESTLGHSDDEESGLSDDEVVRQQRERLEVIKKSNEAARLSHPLAELATDEAALTLHTFAEASTPSLPRPRPVCKACHDGSIVDGPCTVCGNEGNEGDDTSCANEGDEDDEADEEEQAAAKVADDAAAAAKADAERAAAEEAAAERAAAEEAAEEKRQQQQQEAAEAAERQKKEAEALDTATTVSYNDHDPGDPKPPFVDIGEVDIGETDALAQNALCFSR